MVQCRQVLVREPARQCVLPHRLRVDILRVRLPASSKSPFSALAGAL
jgi:hypothetical protein